MKILDVTSNNRKHLFEIHTRSGEFVFPYAKASPKPSPTDRIVDLFVDPELGKEGFTYVLESGKEGSIHIDSVLEYNEEPGYMTNLSMYRLTTEARRRFETSGLSARELSRWLGTSPTQLYRLLEPTNYSKSLSQLISLLYHLGADVEFDVKDRRPAV